MAKPYRKICLQQIFRTRLGFHPLTSKEEPASLTYNIQYQNGQREMISCSGRRLQFTAEHLPALRTDSYVWCADDYLSSVRFELKGLDFPGVLYRSFGNTWTDIDKMLLEDESFGNLLKMRNPYREEMAALALDTLADRHKKIATIYSFLKKKISWNDQYRIYGDGMRKAVKNGTGSNADINFVLMSMLHDADIPCYPAVMSRKTMGILPYAHPSVQKLNTFVVAIADTDSTFVFLDGSVNNGIDVLPPVLMVDRARLITKAGENNWVDLSKFGKNQLRASIIAQIHADGRITGTRNTRYLGQYAADFRKHYHEAKDSMEYVSKLETEEDIKIINYRTEELEHFSPQVTESFEYEKQAMVNNDFIYVNPLIFMHIGKCPFVQAERQLPIEIPHPEHVQLAAQLTLPEGYAVEELPKPMFFVTGDGQGSCRYNINQLENKITTTYTFVFNKLLTPPNEYKAIKSFWETVVEKNNEILVLKKL